MKQNRLNWRHIVFSTGRTLLTVRETHSVRKNKTRFFSFVCFLLLLSCAVTWTCSAPINVKHPLLCNVELKM